MATKMGAVSTKDQTPTTHINETERGRGQPYMLGKAIEAVKDAVHIGEYAATLTQLRRGRGRCPVHEGDNPQSFTMYPEDGRWHCYSCGEHGDVIDLAKSVEGHAETWTAVISLATRFAVELPQRPESWCRRQAEKAADRRRALEVVTESYRRRFYRLYAPIVLDLIEDPAERQAEGDRIWRDLYPVAKAAARRRVEGGVHA